MLYSPWPKRARWHCLTYLWFVLALTAFAVKAKSDEPAPLAEFALPEYADALLAPLNIAGENHLCCVDSGSRSYAFHTSLREQLGDPIRSVQASASNGERFTIELFRCPRLKVASISLNSSSPIACINLTPIREAEGLEIEGLIGVPFFHENIVRMDFDSHKLIILPQSSTPNAEWEKPIDVQINKAGLGTIAVSIHGTVEECIVDSGFGSTLSIASESFSKLVKDGSITPLADTAVADVQGFKKMQQGRLSVLTVGDIECRNVQVMDGGQRSRIGLGFLRRFLVTADFKHKRLYLAKGAAFGLPERFPVIGLGFVRVKGQTKVRMVSPDSPAEEAELLIDDEIISINAGPISNKPLAEVRWLLRENMNRNRSVNLVVRRDGNERAIVIKSQAP